jgi:protein phosphatase
MKLTIPELSLILLIGASGSGKSTFARQHFLPTEVISSDFCRGLVSDDENNQEASKDAFEVLNYIVEKRLARGHLTVVDATNVQPQDRKILLNLARQYHVFPVAIVFNLSEQICFERNQQRSDRNFGIHVVRRHTQNLKRSLGYLKQEGFRYIFKLSSPEEINAVTIERQLLWNNLKHERGAFDIIGDIHGCCTELEQLLEKLGYVKSSSDSIYQHPEDRKVIFVGDLVDRGDRIIDTLNLVRKMIQAGTAICVAGNHEDKLLRKLRGKKVKINHGLEQTVAEIEALPEEKREQFITEAIAFLDSLVSHYVLDGGNLVVAHAGMKESMQGRGSGQVRAFALYGETTGEIDEFGLPVRYPWAEEYRGKATVVYGHVPIPEAEWINNTIDIDTGCVFGGKLTALRYPEREIVSISAAKVYYEPIKPFLVEENNNLTSQQELDDVLDIADVTGKRFINTRLRPQITIQEENSIAALEIMSRFAANPKWLIYLPPTMSPSETSHEEGLLEHPQEAFTYYQKIGVSQVLCEEKHMGSRAIAIICRDEETAKKRFGVVNEGIGIVYTRTGRRFFNDFNLEQQLLDRLRIAMSATNFWQELNTDWACLDCELMPWSMKAQELIKQQYAAVGTSARVSLNYAVDLLTKTASRGIDVSEEINSYRERQQLVENYVSAYRGYCWQVNSLDDLKLAPFHLLATEGKVHSDRNHLWHMEKLGNICQGDNNLLRSTNYRIVNLNNEAEKQQAIDWWLSITNNGSEGIVVKPLDFIVVGKKDLIQPALKCRGKEYLRIIYGAEYSLADNLERLRKRGLGRKRSLALREFCLGIESLERFVNYQPLRKIHECVFGILALESELIDPRL